MSEGRFAGALSQPVQRRSPARTSWEASSSSRTEETASSYSRLVAGVMGAKTLSGFSRSLIRGLANRGLVIPRCTAVRQCLRRDG
jgi:energy-converting hydrogenase Eha subunit A